ncbi:MAG: response regulator [Candidatus Nealsonbacteria bacterium]|nr:response regulator [Candidatus Nealsonbacteria bacterium]
MPKSIYFVQECPTCGRRLQIRVDYLGREVVCQHCQGKLVARDPANARLDPSQTDSELIRRADELLDSVQRRQAQARSNSPR